MCQTVDDAKELSLLSLPRIHDVLKCIGFLQNNVVDICGYMQLILIPPQECPHHGWGFNQF